MPNPTPAEVPPTGATDPPPAPPRRRIFSADVLEHADVPDRRFDDMDRPATRGTTQGLATFLGVDSDELAGYTTGHLMSALCHLVVGVGQGVLQWSRSTPAVNPTDLEGLLNVAGRRTMREDFRRGIQSVYRDAERRRSHREGRGGGYAEEPAPMRPRYDEGSGWESSAPRRQW